MGSCSHAWRSWSGEVSSLRNLWMLRTFGRVYTRLRGAHERNLMWSLRVRFVRRGCERGDEPNGRRYLNGGRPPCSHDHVRAVQECPATRSCCSSGLSFTPNSEAQCPGVQVPKDYQNLQAVAAHGPLPKRKLYGSTICSCWPLL
jgi:hypothetical protein